MLDHASAAAVRALAVHPVVRGGHVTLAHRVDPAKLDEAWIPGGAAIGERLELRAIGVASNERVQALSIEMAGTSTRPWDGGRLHVTISRAEDASSAESNALLAGVAIEPIELTLSGTVDWVE